jgi:hypothetical protein
MKPESGKETILGEPPNGSNRHDDEANGSARAIDDGAPPEASVAEPPQPALSASIWQQLRPTILSVLILSLLTGLVFPVGLAVPGWLLFPQQSAGSVKVRRGVVVGSQQIGHACSRPGYFHPRPSAAGNGYDGLASGGTNLGPANPKLASGSADDPTTSVDESFAGVR